MEKKKRTVCLITPGHLASDPRLVKEAAALSGAGYSVHIIFTQYVSYLIYHDEVILKEHSEWTYDCLDWAKTDFKTKKTRFFSGLRINLLRHIPFIRYRNKILVNRHFGWQCKKAVAVRASLYIAHNLGALPVAAFAAVKTNSPFAFDAEDFHRHEISDDTGHPDVKIKICLEEKYLPKAAYITAASPMIAEHYQKISGKTVTPILNVFNRVKTASASKQFLMPHEPLRIFWFSQTIGPNRGLETAVEAINRVTEHAIELHILGSAQPDFVLELQKKSKNFHQHKHSLHVHKPVSQDELLRRTSEFDIGLASESGFSINNNIALSNKLFTYIQCGLAVLISDTQAQKQFFKQNPGTGKCYEKENAESLAEAIIFYAQNRHELLKTREHNFQLGQHVFNWETESQKFIAKIKQVLP